MPMLEPPTATELRRHDLQAEATIVRGHAQLLRRKVDRMDGLTVTERAELCLQLEAIDRAGQHLSLGIVDASWPSKRR